MTVCPFQSTYTLLIIIINPPYMYVYYAGPTMVTELTTLAGDQNGVVNEGARISVMQCTGKSAL